MTFIPNYAMRLAAERGLALAETIDEVDHQVKTVAARIMNGEAFEREEVAVISAFFSENHFDRSVGWERTPAGVSHMLYGGDAGKAWTASKLKEEGGEESNPPVGLSEEIHREVAEMFFADRSKTAKVGDDGLVWKAMLPEGTWKVGPLGTPLKVIAGRSSDPRKAIGMQDLIDSFEDGAVPHVTIPKTHDDKVDENTGYIRKLKIVEKDGLKTLMGGHEFTDKAIAQKVAEGSIANTSVGIEFGYVRKEDGKKFSSVLRHNALTNRPFLGNKLPAFGLEEERDDFTVMCAEFSEPFPSGATSETEDTIIDMSEKDTPTKNHQEAPVAADKNDEPTGATTPTALDLSENPLFLAEQQKNAALQAQLDQLAAKDRSREADDYVTSLKRIGLTEEAGCTDFLKTVRNILLSDKGEAQILLSEDGDQTPRPFTAGTLVRELIGKLPIGDNGKLALQLSEQQGDPLAQSHTQKPPTEDQDGTVALSERLAAADAFLDEHGLASAPKNKEN